MLRKGLIYMENGIKPITLEWKQMTAGSCGQIEKLTNKQKPWQHIQFPAHFFLINHPKHGYVLVDTGYSTHFETHTKAFPYSLYAKTTPISFSEEQSALSQLKKLGISPDDIHTIFITHFHADHVAGLRDFPNAKFICSKKAYDFLKNKKGIPAVLKGFVPGLLPDDFKSRVSFFENLPETNYKQLTKEVEALLEFDSPIYDVFGDGSLFSVDVSGHAHGQMGLFFYDKEMPVFLVADAAWDSSAIYNLEYPSRLTALIMTNFNEFKTNLERLHAYHQTFPEVVIIPSHFREWKGEVK